MNVCPLDAKLGRIRTKMSTLTSSSKIVAELFEPNRRVPFTLSPQEGTVREIATEDVFISRF